MSAKRGFVVAAPTSGAGKTLVMLGMLSALKRRGYDVAATKSGPDYIDPQFHQAATGHPSVNLDAWAMTADTIQSRAASQPGDVLLVEGAMGVLDGAGVEGRGSVAELANILGLPVVLVVDTSKMAQSAVLSAVGLQAMRPDLHLAGIILNRVGSPRHEAALRHAFKRAALPVLGVLPRMADLVLPERHLGLVQAMESDGLAATLESVARLVEERVDLDQLLDTSRPLNRTADAQRFAPIGQRIAVARDIAFAFSYPHMLHDWRAHGAEMAFFSPLADEAPPENCDAIFLPGGYPELHAEKLAQASTFKRGVHSAAIAGKTIYGECGGYMVLGETLTDAEGATHEMLGLLPVATSFARRKLHLGYRLLRPVGGSVFQEPLAGHEFHYASITSEADENRLFEAEDAFGETLPSMGHRKGQTLGSFAHVIGPLPV
ncbi:MAG: cobyrinate a,c-diamide synthase [Pseudomonadota bacterium]